MDSRGRCLGAVHKDQPLVQRHQPEADWLVGAPALGMGIWFYLRRRPPVGGAYDDVLRGSHLHLDLDDVPLGPRVQLLFRPEVVDEKETNG